MVNKYMAIIEVDCVVFKEIMKLQKINIGWDRCSIFEHFSIVRCFNCCGFNHHAGDCKWKKACSKCGDEDDAHNETECLNPQKCINCVKANHLFNLNLEVAHSCYDGNCERIKQQVEKYKKMIQYEL